MSYTKYLVLKTFSKSSKNKLKFFYYFKLLPFVLILSKGQIFS